MDATDARENVPNRVPNVPKQENSLAEMEEKILALIAENPIITSQSIAGFSWQTSMVCYIWMAAGKCCR
jgi:hypothetical protein